MYNWWVRRHHSPMMPPHPPVVHHSPIRPHTSPIRHSLSPRRPLHAPYPLAGPLPHPADYPLHGPLPHPADFPLSGPLPHPADYPLPGPVPHHHSPARCHSHSPDRHSPHRHHSHSPVRHHSPARHCVEPTLHPIDEDALINGLRDLIAQERELENSKVALTMKPDFNLHDAFVIFDHCRHGAISQADLREGLAAIGVFPTADEVSLFFQRYDLNKNHRIGFKEFTQAFLSDDNYYCHMLNRRPSNHRHHLHRRDDCFFPETQVEHRNMWRVHFKVEAAAEAVRQRLCFHPHFNVV